MNWDTLISTAIGALLALGGTVIAGIFSNRDSHKRESRSNRQERYLEYALAAEATHDNLRKVADPHREHANIASELSHAMSESRIYGAREKLLVTSSPAIIQAGEGVLNALAHMRRKIRDGAQLNTLAYHEAYHVFSNSIWRLRRIAREEFGNGTLKPEDVGKPDWDSQENCDFCRTARAAVQASAATAAQATVPAARQATDE